MSRRRQGATEVRHGGYTYRLGLPVSEQPPVLRVTCKFSYKTESPEDVSITKEELLGLASVYHRIYQVPEKTRERLTKWRRAHRRMVESWQMHFWNSRPEDHRLGLIARKPGIPPAALGRQPEPEPEEESEETVDHNGMDVDESSDAVNSDRAQQPREITPESSPPPAQYHPMLPEALRTPKPAASNGHSQNDEGAQAQSAKSRPEDLLAELEAARECIKDMFVWFQQAAVTVDENDPLKEALMQMSWRAAQGLDRTSQAVRASKDTVNEGKQGSAEEIARRISERRAMVARQTRKDGS